MRTNPQPHDAATASIETLAGGGPIGDGGPATAARLHLPGGVLISPDGDLVIVDFGNHRIRRIDSKGRIETMTGTGEAGFNGDGIPAERAQLSRPEYAAYGPRGGLYIADSYNNRIRRIDPETGRIETVAGSGERGFGGDGGPATGAALHFPEGLSVDAAGNLYIGDMGNRRVRRVDAETGIITTFAGTGQVGTSPDGTPALEASFLRVARMMNDAAGNLYLADSPSHTIQRIDLETHRVHVIAGTGEPGFSGDGGPARDARIAFPEGLIVAPNGDVYFADVGNHRVRRIDGETGRITTIAGNGEHGFSGDGGPAIVASLWSPGRLALDADGNLYIADIGNLRVRRVDSETGRISTVAGSGDLGDGGPAHQAMLSVPGDIVYRDGVLFVADYGNRRVRRIDLSNGLISTIAGGGTGTRDGMRATDVELLLPEGIALHDRWLYIADNPAHRVWRVDLVSGKIFHFAGTGRQGFSGDGGPAGQARLSLPGAVSVGTDGEVYIADFGNRRIRRVDPETGTIDSLDSASRFLRRHLARGVISLEATADGLYQIVNEDSTAVERLQLDRQLVERLPIRSTRPAAAGRLIDLAVDDGRIYVADALAHQVLRLDLSTGQVELVAGSGAEGFAGDGGPAVDAALFQPGGVAIGRRGRELFIADAKNHRIRRVILPAAEEGPP